MDFRYVRGWVAFLGLAGIGSGEGRSLVAQTGTAPPSTTVPASSTAPASSRQVKKAAARQRGSAAGGQTQRIPIEQAPPSPPSPDETPAQRAADQRLLQQQQTQSARAAQITDQQVNTAQQRIDKVQNEQRIQDAPGPAQTGVVPAAGVPVAPAAGGNGVSGGPAIQDAPGPGQTPSPATAVPAPAPATQPIQPPPPPPL